MGTHKSISKFRNFVNVACAAASSLALCPAFPFERAGRPGRGQGEGIETRVREHGIDGEEVGVHVLILMNN